ncbi:MAG: hypothetical protein AAGJ86_04635 [Pseudomonadota bacterium]
MSKVPMLSRTSATVITMVGTFACALVACSSQDTPAQQTATGDAQTAPDVRSPARTVTQPAALETSLCFLNQSATSTSGLKLNTARAGAPGGTYTGRIHNEKTGYWAGFTTILSNGIRGARNEVRFDAVTEVDGDTQETTQRWSFSLQAAELIGEIGADGAPLNRRIKLQRSDCGDMEEALGYAVP